MSAPVRYVPLEVDEAVLNLASQLALMAGEMPYMDAAKELQQLQDSQNPTIDALYHWLSHPNERVVRAVVGRWGDRILSGTDLMSVLRGQINVFLDGVEWCPLVDYLEGRGEGQWNWDLGRLKGWIEESGENPQELLAFDAKVIWLLVAEHAKVMDDRLFSKLDERSEVVLKLLANESLGLEWHQKIILHWATHWEKYGKGLGDVLKTYVFSNHSLPASAREIIIGKYIDGTLRAGNAMDALLADPEITGEEVAAIYSAFPVHQHAPPILQGLAQSDLAAMEILRELAGLKDGKLDRVLAITERATDDIIVRGALGKSKDTLVLGRLCHVTTGAEWLRIFTKLVSIDPDAAISTARMRIPEDVAPADAILPLLRHEERRVRVLAVSALGKKEQSSLLLRSAASFCEILGVGRGRR